ncbi:MAG: hypothetical protein IKH57_19435 [Clostridia bacterium]|nr:hypothetical protein [Clostridia bacterium]
MFGYEILRGRQGAVGHFRESNGKTVIHARGLRPGETYTLYTLTENRAEKRGEALADWNGQAEMTEKCERPFFVAAGGKVLLWQGGEDDYLRACEWIKRERKPVQEKETATAQIKPAIAASDDAQKILEKDIKTIQTIPYANENHPEKTPKEKEETMERHEQEILMEKTTSDPTEPPYTLRAPGDGEPVDTLPE